MRVSINVGTWPKRPSQSDVGGQTLPCARCNVVTLLGSVPNMAYDETMEDEASDRSAVDPADTEYTFERIQLHLDVVKSLREQPWRMRKKLETLR